VAIGLGPHADLILHSVPDVGVALEPKGPYLKRSGEKVIAEYVILPDVRSGVIQAMGLLGNSWDYAEVVSYVALALGRMMCPWLPVSRPTPQQWSCARFVMQIDPTGTAIPEWKGVDPKTATPGALLNVIGPSFAKLS
jgi:hypothetical protein